MNRERHNKDERRESVLLASYEEAPPVDVVVELTDIKENIDDVFLV